MESVRTVQLLGLRLSLVQRLLANGTYFLFTGEEKNRAERGNK